MRANELPIEGFIDSASTYQVVAACELGDPGRCFPWAWIVINDVTMLLIFAQHLRMSPGPGALGDATDLYGILVDALRKENVLDWARPPAAKLERALARTKKAMSSDAEITALRRRIDELNEDGVNYLPWLEWGVEHAWLEHSRRLGCIVNPEFRDEVALTLGADEDDIGRLIALSSDPVQLVQIMRHDNADLQLLKDAYLTSALIRGKYHEVAVGRSAQLFRHPFRAGPTEPRELFAAERTQYYFTSALLAGALTEKSPEARIVSWVEMVMKARRAYTGGSLRLFDENPGSGPLDHDSALKSAVEQVSALDLAGPSRRTERFIDAGIQIGLVGLGIVLSDPVILGALGLAGLGTSLRSPAKALVQREKRISELAKAGPGIIDPTLP